MLLKVIADLADNLPGPREPVIAIAPQQREKIVHTRSATHTPASTSAPATDKRPRHRLTQNQKPEKSRRSPVPRR